LLRAAPQTPPLLLEVGDDEKGSLFDRLAGVFDELEAN